MKDVIYYKTIGWPSFLLFYFKILSLKHVDQVHGQFLWVNHFFFLGVPHKFYENENEVVYFAIIIDDKYG